MSYTLMLKSSYLWCDEDCNISDGYDDNLSYNETDEDDKWYRSQAHLFEDLETENQLLRKKVKDYKVKDEKNLSSIDRLRRINETSRDEIQDLEYRVSSLKTKLDKKKREMDRLHDQLHLKIESGHYMTDNYKTQLREIIKSRSFHINELSSFKDTKAQLDAYQIIQDQGRRIHYLESLVDELDSKCKEHTIANGYHMNNTAYQNADTMTRNQSQVHVVQIQLKAAEQKLAEKEKDVERLETIRGNLIKQIKDGKEKVRVKVADEVSRTIKLQEQTRELNEIVKKKNSEIERLKDIINDRENEVEKLKRNEKEKNMKLHELEKRTKYTKQGSVKHQQHNYDNCKDCKRRTGTEQKEKMDIGERKSTIAMNEKVHSLEIEIKKRDGDNKKLQEELKRMHIDFEKEIQESKDKVERLQSLINEEQHMTKMIQDELMTTKSELDKERKLRKEIESNNLLGQIMGNSKAEDKLRQQIQNFEADIKRRDDKVKRRDDKIRHMKIYLAKYETDARNNERNIADLQKQNKQLKQASETAESKLYELLSERNEEQRQQQDSKIMKHHYEAEVKEMKSKDDEKGKQIALQAEEIQSLKRKLQSQGRTVQELMQQKSKVDEKDKDLRAFKVKDDQISKLQNKLEDVIYKLRSAEKELEETKTRLSKAMGDRLTDNNPNITDLSDTNRPVKLAERYSELYDNQWTDALEVLGKYFEDERFAIQLLIDILKDTNQLCRTFADQQIGELRTILGFPNAADSDIPSAIHKGMKDLRKATAQKVMKNMYERYISQLQRSAHSRLQKALEVTPFVRECLELCWLMTVQDPPVVFAAVAESGSRLDTNIYRPYTSTGTMVEFTVWPALLLHEGGPILAKGVAQGCRIGSDKKKRF